METVFAQLHQLLEVWVNCISLLESLRLPTSAGREEISHRWVTTPRPYRDTLMLAVSAVSVVFGIFAACALWIYSGWTDGALGVSLATVACCFFATLDDPASQITQYFVAVCCSILISGFYVIEVVPHTQDFAMLVVILFVPFVLIGTVIPRAKYAVGTMLTAVNTATFLSIQDIYNINFDSFLNLNIAGPIGLLFAIVWMRLTKPFGADWLVSRHTRKSWSDIVIASSLRPIQSYKVFLSRAIDRLMQVLQRQASRESERVFPSSESVRETRIIFSAIALNRLRNHVPTGVRASIECVLRELGSYFRTCGDSRQRKCIPAPLLQSINDAMELVHSLRVRQSPAELTITTAMDEIALELSALRTALVRGRPGAPN